MTDKTYPATPYLARLTSANGWWADLIRDRDGHPSVLVAVRIGTRWIDSVAIEGEDRTVAMRHRNWDDRLILPTEQPSESRAVWQRDGRCEDVLAELFELPDPTL